MQTYKGIKYRVMRSSFGTVNIVHVFFGDQTWDFDTIKQAKSFINSVA